MPTPESVALAHDPTLLHAVAGQFRITPEQAFHLVYWQPDIVEKMNNGGLTENHAAVTRALSKTMTEYIARRPLRRPAPPPARQARRRPQIDRQLVEGADDDFDYSKLEGGALGLTTGPSAAQLWFQDPHPQLLEFLSKPHPAISA